MMKGIFIAIAAFVFACLIVAWARFGVQILLWSGAGF
jgi:hypothetical protein